jgi:hypothetical protein
MSTIRVGGSMSKYIGKGATVKDPKSLTFGRPCVICGYDGVLRKYQVEFDGAWQGWYKINQLKLDGVK